MRIVETVSIKTQTFSCGEELTRIMLKKSRPRTSLILLLSSFFHRLLVVYIKSPFIIFWKGWTGIKRYFREISIRPLLSLQSSSLKPQLRVFVSLMLYQALHKATNFKCHDKISTSISPRSLKKEHS